MEWLKSFWGIAPTNSSIDMIYNDYLRLDNTHVTVMSNFGTSGKCLLNLIVKCSLNALCVHRQQSQCGDGTNLYVPAWEQEYSPHKTHYPRFSRHFTP